MAYQLDKEGSVVNTTINEEYDNNPRAVVGWDDLRFPANTVGLGATAPTFVDFKGGKVLAFQDSPGDPIVYFNIQLPHSYKIGTDLKPHIHFSLPTAGSGVGAENVKFDMTYSWAEIGAEFPTETTISLSGDIQDANAGYHSYAGFDTDILDSNKSENSGAGVSSMLVCSLKRDNSVADNYSDDIYLMEFDVHIQIDQERGSRQEFVK